MPLPLAIALGVLGAGGLLSRKADMNPGQEQGMLSGLLTDIYRSSAFANSSNARRAQAAAEELQAAQMAQQQQQQRAGFLADAGFPTAAPWAQNLDPQEVRGQLNAYQRAIQQNQATAAYNMGEPQRQIEAYQSGLDIQGKELQNQKRALEIQQAIEAANQPAGPERVGENMLIQGPDGPQLVPIPGGKVSREAQAKAASLGRLERNVAELSDLVGEYGTELFGEVSGQMEAIHGAILGDLKNMFELGVLQQGDIEFLNKLVPDPTTLGNVKTGRKRLQAQYGRLMQEVQDRLLINQGYERID